MSSEKMKQTAVWLTKEQHEAMSKHPNGLGAGVRDAIDHAKWSRALVCNSCGASEKAWTRQPTSTRYKVQT